MIIGLLAVLCVTAVLVLAFRDLLVSVILLAFFSLMSALLFYLLKAPDLAIAEAAVGAGIATALYARAVSRTRQGEE